jgi:NDP-sugar pyrophosphorylase family protein
MNAGIYILNKKIIKFLKKKSFSLEDEIITFKEMLNIENLLWEKKSY